ncbi:hypothetical protein [Burkholderia gladioli]|uniref:hypothetical protein n=1 Tax=Burkholderia gladioli TaxID=28095 RepID=UPI00163E8AA6|nr:hypothetical protein [Burkholderia gladioli]
MSATPEELMICAEKLLGNADTEADYRAMCSRAYYAAYHATYAFHKALAVPGSVVRASGSHEQLVSQLLNPGVKDANAPRSRALGKNMLGLLATRIEADYHLQASIDKHRAQATLQSARVTVDQSK